MPAIVSKMQFITAQRAPRIGMSEINGSALSGAAHLVQSIKNIFNTQKNQRVMLRHYGMTNRLDETATAVTIQHVYSEMADQLDEFEPRFKLAQISSEIGDDHQIKFTFTGTDIDNNALTVTGDT